MRPITNRLLEAPARYRVMQKDEVCFRIEEQALETLDALVRRGVSAIPRRGLEVGGILIGSRDREGAVSKSITIDRVLPVPIEYAFGPSFRLSHNDEPALKSAAAGIRDREGGVIVGHYRSHTRGAAEVTADDLFISELLRPEVEPVILLIEASPQTLPLGFIFLGDNGEPWTPMLRFSLREKPVPEPDSLNGERLTTEPYFGGQWLEKTVGSRPPAPMFTEAILAESRGAFGATQAADPIPTPTVPSRRRKFPLSISNRNVIVFACLVLVMLVQLAFWPVRSSIAPRFWEPRQQIGLSIEREPTGLRIGWLRKSVSVLEANGGILEIQDSEKRHRFELTREQLLTGTVFYGRLVSDLSVRLEVQAKSGNIYETVQYIGLLPSTSPPLKPGDRSADPPMVPSLARRPTDSEVPAARLDPVRVMTKRPFVAPPPSSSPQPEARIEELPPHVEPTPAVHPSSSFLTAGNAIPRIDLPPSRPRQPTVAPPLPATSLISYRPPVPLSKVSPAPGGNVRQLVMQDVEIEVRVNVDEQGNVSNAIPISADSGLRSLLADYAVRAARQWKFQPGEVNGRKVPSETTLKFQFARMSR